MKEICSIVSGYEGGMKKMFLQIQGIKKSFGAGDSRVDVLKGLDLDIERGSPTIVPPRTAEIPISLSSRFSRFWLRSYT